MYSGPSGTLLRTFTGEAVSDQFGRSVSGAGDVDNDGYDDVIIGAYFHNAGAGRAYVYSGQSGALLHTFDGQAGFDAFGISVSGATMISAPAMPVERMSSRGLMGQLCTAFLAQLWRITWVSRFRVPEILTAME